MATLHLPDLVILGSVTRKDYYCSLSLNYKFSEEAVRLAHFWVSKIWLLRTHSCRAGKEVVKSSSQRKGTFL